MLSAGMRAKGLDYRTLGALAGVSHTYLWQLAGGGARGPEGARSRPKRPSREIAVRVAELLELDIRKTLEAAGYGQESATSGSQAAILRYATLRPDVPALFQKGLEEARRGHPDRAVVLLKEAVNQGGVSFIRAHTGLGVAYMGTQDHAAAIAEFSKALALFDLEAAGSTPGQPQAIDGVDLADVLYNRGLAHQDMGRHGEAVRDFKGAIRTGGPHPDLYFAALCFSDLALGRFRRVLRAALEYFGDEAAQSCFTTAALDIRLYQAYALARLGQFEAGLALADTVQMLCPSYWYSSFVGGAIASRYAGFVQCKIDRSAARSKALAGQAHADRLTALLGAGSRYCKLTLKLNPAGRASLLAERDEDFAFFSGQPGFADFFTERAADTDGDEGAQ